MLNAMEIQLNELYTNENGVKFMIFRNTLDTLYVAEASAPEDEGRFPFEKLRFFDYFNDAVNYVGSLHWGAAWGVRGTPISAPSEYSPALAGFSAFPRKLLTQLDI